MVTLEEIWQDIDMYSRCEYWNYVVDGKESKPIMPRYLLFLSALENLGGTFIKSAVLGGKPTDADIDKIIEFGYVTELTMNKELYLKITDKMKRANYIHS